MLDQPYMTDMIEAQSMGYKQDIVDIYSASWGPTDDGKTCDGPRKLTMRSIVKGVNEVNILSAYQFASMLDYPRRRLFLIKLPEQFWSPCLIPQSHKMPVLNY